MCHGCHSVTLHSYFAAGSRDVSIMPFLLKPFIVLHRHETQVEERHDFTKHKDFHEDGNSHMKSNSQCQDAKPCGLGPNQNRKQDEFIQKCCVRNDTSQKRILS